MAGIAQRHQVFEVVAPADRFTRYMVRLRKAAAPLCDSYSAFATSIFVPFPHGPFYLVGKLSHNTHLTRLLVSPIPCGRIDSKQPHSTVQSEVADGSSVFSDGAGATLCVAAWLVPTD